MTTTLQEALIKAGLAGRDKLKKSKAKKSVGFLEGKHHHHLRTECEACRKGSPDVEYYEHAHKGLPHKWLCVKCADACNILDQYRQTMQSPHAQQGVFRRQYGPTKVFK